MVIVPLAFDSMGARGSSCLVEVGGKKILIDPGVNLGPKRHKLPPHPLEEERKKSLWGRIKLSGEEADIIVLTHYHYDHLNPEGYDVFYNKTIFLKHPEKNLNYNQMRRASLLMEDIKNKVQEIVFADGITINMQDVTISFSQAVPHGMDTRRGCVIQVFIEGGSESFLFTSDIEGANLNEQIDFIIERNPDILLIDGPAITFPECRSHRISEIVEKTDIKKIVIDHHIMRETNWKEYIEDAYMVAREKGVEILSAAEFKGEEEDLLEARRVELYEKYPI